MLVDRVDMDSWFFWMIDLVTAQKVSRSDSTVNCVFCCACTFWISCFCYLRAESSDVLHRGVRCVPCSVTVFMRDCAVFFVIRFLLAGHGLFRCLVVCFVFWLACRICYSVLQLLIGINSCVPIAVD